ncbi:hypothetical protein QQF64_003450 [Cirrhinus molitorella]|uniref:Uncharacterized protein n=1 Tax=Cirrhinus molitorella TaxID=172907 RepID=A0ABR3MLC2_9TELE
MTKITASPSVLAGLAADTTEAIKHTVSTRRSWKKRKACVVPSNALSVLPIETMPISPVMPTDSVLLCHVSSILMPPEALFELAAPPVMATEADAEAFILPALAIEASCKLTAFPLASKDVIPASHVNSKNVIGRDIAKEDVLSVLSCPVQQAEHLICSPPSAILGWIQQTPFLSLLAPVLRRNLPFGLCSPPLPEYFLYCQ